MKLIFIIFSLFFSLSLLAAEFKVTRFFGKVLVNGEKMDKSFPLQVGDEIEAIGKKSFVQVKSSFGSVFLIRNGKLKLDKFNAKESNVSLTRGKFFHFFNKQNKNKRKFNVKTKHAVMGVRGTKYMIDSNDDQDYLCVCEGTVSAKKNGEANSHNVDAGQDLFFYLNSKKSHVKRATKKMYEMTSDEFSAMGYAVDKKALLETNF